MKSLHITLAWLLFCSTSLGVSVELNVVPSDRAPFNAAQDWVRVLAKLKSVRVRSAGGQSSVRPDVKRSSTTVRITAVIDSQNRLVVPGRSFTIRQLSAIQSWLDEQRKDSGSALSTKDRFGLTTAQLNRVHETLKTVVREPTEGKRVSTVVQAIARQVGLPVRPSAVARERWGDAATGEWKEFSSGTAMAAVLRPLELIVVPKANVAGRIELVVTSEDAVPEGWPVGWKSQLKKRELVPKIHDPLPIAVNQTPIADVIAALSSRLEIPMMYDWALLKVMQIDPATTKVTYNSKRTIYSKAISQTLFKAQLKSEMRVDERGKPFLWITPRRTPKSIPRRQH